MKYYPVCGQETTVKDTRLVQNGHQVKRRRVCEACNYRVTTYEVTATVESKVKVIVMEWLLWVIEERYKRGEKLAPVLLAIKDARRRGVTIPD